MIEGHDLRKALCPKCLAEMRVDVLKEHKTSWVDDEHPIDGQDRYWILECRGCEKVFFGHGSTFSEHTDHRLNPLTGEWHQYCPEDVTFYPRALQRQKPVWFTWKFQMSHQRTSSLLAELYQALDNDMPVLTAMASRIVFDAVSEELKIDPSISFADKIESLRKAQHITGRERDFLQLLINAGSAAAHQGWSPTNEQLSTLLEILEGFIHRTLVLPSRVEGMQTEVPKKKK